MHDKTVKPNIYGGSITTVRQQVVNNYNNNKCLNSNIKGISTFKIL